ncbi:hypothetical protein VOA_000813 [Vibrio sp. RC586]|nr:hypothetical protein VOA_000813 [Vibrio sp. RC586]
MYAKIKNGDDTAPPLKFNPSRFDGGYFQPDLSFYYDKAFNMTENANSRKMRAIVSRHASGEAKTPMTHETSHDTFN